MRIRSTSFDHRGRRKRRGVTITEVMVGCSVLAVILPTMTSLFVRSRRLMQHTRHQRLVLDELSSHVDVLIADPSRVDFTQAVNLPVSPALSLALPSALITAKITQSKSDRWIQVSAQWQYNENTQTRSLTSWLSDPDDSDFNDSGDALGQERKQ